MLLIIAGQIGRFLEISTRRLQLFITPCVICGLMCLQYCTAVLRHRPLLYLSAAAQQHEVSNVWAHWIYETLATTNFNKSSQTNFTQNLPVADEFFHSEGRTYVTKLTGRRLQLLCEGAQRG